MQNSTKKLKKIGNSFFQSRKNVDDFCRNIEAWAVQKHVNLVELVKSFPMSLFLNLLFEQIANSNEYLLGEIGLDTAENEPLEVL